MTEQNLASSGGSSLSAEELCYYKLVGDVANQLADSYVWDIISPTRAQIQATFLVNGLPEVVTFTLTKIGGADAIVNETNCLDGITATTNAFVHNTVGGTTSNWRLSWDKNIIHGYFRFRFWDIDPTETLTFDPVPDTFAGTGNQVQANAIWNNFEGQTYFDMEFTGNCFGLIAEMQADIQAVEIAPINLLYQMAGTPVYFDPIANQTVVDPWLVDCPTYTDEIITYCDVIGAGNVVQFLRRYTNNGDGTVTTVDTTLDGVTPYVVQGSVVECNSGTWIETLCDAVSGPVGVTNTPGANQTVTTWPFIFDFKFSPDLTATLTRTTGANNQFIVASVDGRWTGVTGAGEGPATYLLNFNLPYTGILEIDVNTVDAGESYGLFRVNGVYTYPDVATLEPISPNSLTYDQNGTFQFVVTGATSFQLQFLGATGRAAYNITLYENVKQSFQRVFKSDPLGNVTSEDYDFDGNPYTPKATVGKCTAQYDEQILCDVILSQASNPVVAQTNQAFVTSSYTFSTDLNIIATISNTAGNTTLAAGRDFYKTTVANTTWGITLDKALSGRLLLVIVNTGQTFGSVNSFSIPPDSSTLTETSPGSGSYTVGTNSGTFGWDITNLNSLTWNEVVGTNQIHYRLYLYLYYTQEFVRHYVLDSEDNLTYFDTDENGNFYAVLGTPQSCNAELQETDTLEAWAWELGPTDVWSVNDIPAGYTITSVTITVMNKGENNDNQIVGQGAAIVNLDTGLSLTWGCEDKNILVPPKNASAGTGASSRMLVHATLRRNKI